MHLQISVKDRHTPLSETDFTAEVANVQKPDFSEVRKCFQLSFTFKPSFFVSIMKGNYVCEEMCSIAFWDLSSARVCLVSNLNMGYGTMIT